MTKWRLKGGEAFVGWVCVLYVSAETLKGFEEILRLGAARVLRADDPASLQHVTHAFFDAAQGAPPMRWTAPTSSIPPLPLFLVEEGGE